MTPTRYPLAWPTGWMRMPDHARKDASFKRYDKRLSVFDGVQRVLGELQRLGVNEADVVISANVETRLDGFPRSDRAAPSDPGVCVYWKRQSQLKCMAIDRYEKVADNLAAVAATLDAMRAIERHGGGTILDRAFNGFTALPAEDVQKAYRRLASQHHTDRPGGSHDKMAELNAARDHALQEIKQ